MNQLSGKYVNVVLSIEDIKGIGFVKYPIHIEANFNGRPLESDKIIPDDPTSFNTELIWEADKKDLRKMRSSNQPLKVECISTDAQNRRDRIGFVLLSLRSALIVPMKDAKIPITLKWYNLIGCQADKKKFHPELYLALTIRDHLVNTAEDDLSKTIPLIYEEEQNTNLMQDNIPIPDSSSQFHLKYLEDGHIKVGDDLDFESFCLNLLLKEAKNLDTLLPEQLVFRSSTEKYHMTFKLFGVTIRTKLFHKHLQDSIILNEKLVVRLLSNKDTLLNFLKMQSVEITLFSGNVLLGMTEVNLEHIMEFEENDERCYFQMPKNNNSNNAKATMILASDNLMPFIDIRMWIKRSNNKVSPGRKSIKTNLEMAGGPSPRGDGDWIDHVDPYNIQGLKKVEVKPKSELILHTVSDSSSIRVTKSANTIQLSPRSLNAGGYDISKTYAKYVMEVSLKNFIWLSAPDDRIVIFKFLHARASNTITIFTQISNQVGATIDLGNMGINITYVSNGDQLENILNAWPPKLVLTDEKEKPLTAPYEFDAKKVLSSEQRNYKYIAELLGFKSLTPLVKIQINLRLHATDLNQQSVIETDTDFHLNPPIVDELLTLRQIANLEEWKKLQMEKFQIDLKQFKETESLKLEDSWNDRRIELEKNLDKQIMKCIKLQKELEEKVDQIKTEKFLTRSRNQANIIQEIFNKNWETYDKSDIKHILEHFSKTQRDNEYLKHLVGEQRNQLKTLENTLLTKQESNTILEELKQLEKGFEEAQCAKQYFIEQWQMTGDDNNDKIESDECKKAMENELEKIEEDLSQISIEEDISRLYNDDECNNSHLSSTVISETLCD